MNTETNSDAPSCVYGKQTYATITLPSGIDINGLNLCDRERITRIGFRAWFNEACAAQEERFARKAELGDTTLTLSEVTTTKASAFRKTCEVCGRKFPSKRASRKTCSERCKKRRQRRTV